MSEETNKTQESQEYSIENDPANDCLDAAIITDPKLRSEKNIKKLVNIAGRILNKKKWKLMANFTERFGLKIM